MRFITIEEGEWRSLSGAVRDGVMDKFDRSKKA